MKYVYPFLFLILIISFSCDSKKTQANDAEIDSLVVNSNRISNTISETLIPSARKDFDSWKEYKDVDDLITEYYNISISEALFRSEELVDLVKLMKDTIRVDAIDKLNVVARFNVLHNEALRLSDMSMIPSISDEEVSEEVGQIIEVYSSVNAKINTIYKAQDLQDALEVDTEIPINVIEDDSTRKPFKKIPKSPATSSTKSLIKSRQ